MINNGFKRNIRFHKIIEKKILRSDEFGKIANPNEKLFGCLRQALTPKKQKSNDVAEIVFIISEVSTGSTSEEKNI